MYPSYQPDVYVLLKQKRGRKTCQTRHLMIHVICVHASLEVYKVLDMMFA